MVSAVYGDDEVTACLKRSNSSPVLYRTPFMVLVGVFLQPLSVKSLLLFFFVMLLFIIKKNVVTTRPRDCKVSSTCRTLSAVAVTSCCMHPISRILSVGHGFGHAHVRFACVLVLVLVRL